jgi:hypothetical protein
VGDLCETYVSLPQYAGEAMRTVPFMIFSLARRNANLPTLGLQIFLVFICLGGLSFSRPDLSQVAILTLVMLGLLLRSAYRPLGRPSTRRAIIETILVAYGALVYSQGVMLGMDVVHHLPHRTLLGMQFGVLIPYVPLVPPLLCLYRAGLIIKSDGSRPFPAYTVKPGDVVADYGHFARRVGRRNRLEAVALGSVAIFGTSALRALPGAYLPFGLALILIYVLAAYYLLGDGGARPLPADADFTSLRALYAGELLRQQQLRSFLMWLWLAPLLIWLHASLTTTGQPVVVAFGTATAILSCFIISAFNREYGGWVQEKIGMLDRVPEDIRAVR